jgi:NAD(P)-dependent dehydrogenase (short-subunit alcohol dehydrogenase family)
MLDGRVAIVTGAGAGLGRAEALALAAAGARVVVNDVGADGAHAVAAEIRAAGGEAVAHRGDVGAWSTGEDLVDVATRRYGRLDVVVNNAGFLRDRMIFNMSEQEWDDSIRVHLKGHFVVLRAATRHWRAASKTAGAPAYARVVNTSSEAFLSGSPGQPNYAAAKAGIVGLTLSVANSCGRYGVRANAICPRARTGMTDERFDAPEDGAADPLSTDHVAPLVVYLASPAADHVTAQVLIVYGGRIGLLGAPALREVFHTRGDAFTPEEIGGALGAAIARDPERTYRARRLLETD